MKSPIISFETGELILIRHAPAATEGRLCGRSDVPLRNDNDSMITQAAFLAEINTVLTSPALRCRQTAAALFPGQVLKTDVRLWEQNFGDEEGVPYTDLPDLGALPRQELALRCPPKGESFAAMVKRVTPALKTLADSAQTGGPVAVVAHAGTVRAGLALALGSVPAALAFDIAPLSMTRLRCIKGDWSVIAVNVTI